MLIQLSIRDIVLIERLDLAFETGLSVLTGETGAGKSILLDSLSLALGGRGDGDLVRHGEDKGQVTAVFDVGMDHAVRRLLRENGIDDDGDLIFRRTQSADGRTKVKSPSGTLSTAEAISVVTHGLALAAHFGDGRLRPADIAEGIVGAVVKDPVADRVVWNEYLEAVARERREWAEFYTACRDASG